MPQRHQRETKQRHWLASSDNWASLHHVRFCLRGGMLARPEPSKRNIIGVRTAQERNAQLEELFTHSFELVGWEVWLH